jgi:hypothetical protein
MQLKEAFHTTTTVTTTITTNVTFTAHPKHTEMGK